MQLTILAVPGCPNAPVLKDRLAAILDGRADITVSHQAISSEVDAARRGMHGSPTLLINGADPFADPSQPPTISCRLYRDDDGQASGAPSVGQLRRAIEQALAATTGASEPKWLDSIGRGGRGRVAPAERGLRPVHQAVLRSFAQTGHAPDALSLATHAAPFQAADVLAELAAGDFLYLDPAGQITAAYPFSARPTRHKVRISGHATVFAMCAIDALGMSAMLGLPVAIESSDPSTGQPITLIVDGAGSTWDPDTAVVYVGRNDITCAGSSAEVCCDCINFFAKRASAETWAASHPEITGGILSQGQALQIGTGIFSELLG